MIALRSAPPGPSDASSTTRAGRQLLGEGAELGHPGIGVRVRQRVQERLGRMANLVDRAGRLHRSGCIEHERQVETALLLDLRVRQRDHLGGGRRHAETGHADQQGCSDGQDQGKPQAVAQRHEPNPATQSGAYRAPLGDFRRVSAPVEPPGLDRPVRAAGARVQPELARGNRRQ